ncbi:hypothetical protein [Oerskovia jenensis]|uniref:hypothetical protein n=1 Tax=Oerskovia jenensis TaxID=162169 RepID=UPI0036DEB70D
MTQAAVCEGRDGFRGCGAQILLVYVIPAHRRKGEPLKKVPLDLTYDPACGVAPSHATNLARPPTQCRSLGRGEDPAPNERAALTHFATCPHRQAGRSTTEGTP